MITIGIVIVGIYLVFKLIFVLIDYLTSGR